MKPLLLAEEVDERDGNVPCHPCQIVIAKHVDLVGADIWNGVKDRKKAKKSLKNARPRRGGRWVATARVYQPEQEIRCPDWWLLTEDVLPGPLTKLLTNLPTWLERRSAEVDAAIGRLLPRKIWTTPRPLDELPAAEALACRLQADFEASVLRHDVFSRMAAWKRYLPGQCDHDDPVAAALQAAFWIRRLYNLRFSDDWRAGQIEHYARGAFHPEGRVLQRYRPARRRDVTKDDVMAALRVIDHSNMILLRTLADKQRRWRAQRPNGTYVADWHIVRPILEDRRSASDVAREIGISPAVVAKRFKAAIVAISREVGPLSSRLGNFARGVGRREKRADKPALRTAEPPAPLPVPWKRISSADVLYHFPKQALPDDRWLIAEALEYFGNSRVPSGCSAGYPVEPARVLDSKRRADPKDEDSAIVGKSAGLKTEGRYVILRPKAVDWRAIARKLSGEAKTKALAKEDHIADLLGDTGPLWPHWPSEPERPYAAAYFNGGKVHHPHNDADDYYGPVVERNGKPVPRRYDSGPAVDRDVVDRFADAMSSLDQFTPLSD